MTEDERGAITRLALYAGVAAVTVGIVCLVWAYQREYRDMQRTYGLAVGWVGLLGGELILLLAAVVWSRRQRSRS